MSSKCDLIFIAKRSRSDREHVAHKVLAPEWEKKKEVFPPIIFTGKFFVPDFLMLAMFAATILFVAFCCLLKVVSFQQLIFFTITFALNLHLHIVQRLYSFMFWRKILQLFWNSMKAQFFMFSYLRKVKKLQSQFTTLFDANGPRRKWARIAWVERKPSQ